MAAIEAADGVVIIDGKQMIRRDVARAVVQTFMGDLVTELRERLMVIVAGDPEAENNLTMELDETARRIEKYIADRYPVVN
jgi:hypothetical protein